MEPASLPLAILLLALSLSSSSLFHLAVADPAGSAMAVEELCGKLKHRDLCVSSIKKMAGGKDSMDLRTALKHELNAANARFLALVHTAESVQSPDAALRMCMVGLNDAKDDIAQALAAIEQDDTGTTSSTSTHSPRTSTTAGDDDSETLLKADADEISDLLDNCWSLFDLIWPMVNNAAHADSV